MSGYTWNADEFAALLLQSYFPERTQRESAIIRDYLREHLGEFERVDFSVRVGQGMTPEPGLLPAVARNVIDSSKLRVDVVGYRGSGATLVEAKTHISREVFGQLLAARHLWLEDHPDAPEPRLVAIGRTVNADALRVFAANGVDVYVYPDESAV